MMVKKKPDGAVDNSSADREIRKSDLTVHNLGKFRGLHLVEPQAGWLTKFGRGLKC